MSTTPESLDARSPETDLSSPPALADQEPSTTRQNGHNPQRPSLPRLEKPGILADDVMSEAGRKILAYHFSRMLSEEDGVRQGAQTDPVHDMRVATRRLRNALDIFSDYYDYKAVKPYMKALRRVARALGEVRDLDVFRLKADKYAETLSEETRQGLNPLLEGWQSQLDDARKTLFDVLDQENYTEFVADFAHFVTTPEKNAIKISHKERHQPHRVRHIAPRLLYQRYEKVRAYETVLGSASLDTLHMLRIEAKHLRYTLEAFQEVLGDGAGKVINAVKDLQDHFGDLQDARVASIILGDYIQDAREQQSRAAILHYMSAKEEEKERLLAQVPEVWHKFTNEEIRRALALSVSVL